MNPITRGAAKAFSSLLPTSRISTFRGSIPAACRIGCEFFSSVSSISVSRIREMPSCAAAGPGPATTAVARTRLSATREMERAHLDSAELEEANIEEAGGDHSLKLLQTAPR
nr:hypothetical protein [Phenylobacterium sp. J426]